MLGPDSLVQSCDVLSNASCLVGGGSDLRAHIRLPNVHFKQSCGGRLTWKLALCFPKLFVALLIYIKHSVQSLGRFKVSHEKCNYVFFTYTCRLCWPPCEKTRRSECSVRSLFCFWSGIETRVLAGFEWVIVEPGEECYIFQPDAVASIQGRCPFLWKAHSLWWLDKERTRYWWWWY